MVEYPGGNNLSKKVYSKESSFVDRYIILLTHLFVLEADAGTEAVYPYSRSTSIMKFDRVAISVVKPKRPTRISNNIYLNQSICIKSVHWDVVFSLY